jgi:hypothetical protein
MGWGVGIPVAGAMLVSILYWIGIVLFLLLLSFLQLVKDTNILKTITLDNRKFFMGLLM